MLVEVEKLMLKYYVWLGFNSGYYMDRVMRFADVNSIS